MIPHLSILLSLVLFFNFNILRSQEIKQYYPGDTLRVYYIIKKVTKKEALVTTQIKEIKRGERNYLLFDWDKAIYEKLELFRFPVYWDFTAGKRMTVIAEQNNGISPDHWDEQVIWTVNDSLGSKRIYTVVNKSDPSQDMEFVITFVKKIEKNDREIIVLLFSNTFFLNSDFKIFIDKKYGFIGGIDVDDLSSNFFAFEGNQDLIREYYFETDWW